MRWGGVTVVIEVTFFLPVSPAMLEELKKFWDPSWHPGWVHTQDKYLKDWLSKEFQCPGQDREEGLWAPMRLNLYALNIDRRAMTTGLLHCLILARGVLKPRNLSFKKNIDLERNLYIFSNLMEKRLSLCPPHSFFHFLHLHIHDFS